MNALANRMLAGALATALGFTLTACAPTAPPAPDHLANSTTPPQNGNGESAIRLVIGDRVVRGTVWHNAAGRSLLDRLPVTVRVSDHQRQEKGGPLAAPLAMDGMPAGADPQPGDLGYFAPATDLVFYYQDAPYWTGIARIGRIDGDMSVVAEAPDGTPVTVERAG